MLNIRFFCVKLAPIFNLFKITRHWQIQESIQLSTTLGPGHHMKKWHNARKHHTTESQEVSHFATGDNKAARNRQGIIIKMHTHVSSSISFDISQYICILRILPYSVSLQGTNGAIRTIIQFHYTAWPDKNVPNYPLSLVRFWNRVVSSKTAAITPWLVHCR